MYVKFSANMIQSTGYTTMAINLGVTHTNLFYTKNLTFIEHFSLST